MNIRQSLYGYAVEQEHGHLDLHRYSTQYSVCAMLALQTVQNRSAPATSSNEKSDFSDVLSQDSLISKNVFLEGREVDPSRRKRGR